MSSSTATPSSTTAWDESSAPRRRPALAVAAATWAQPQPGDRFREFLHVPPRGWERVTDPQSYQPGAQEFLPNPVRTFTVGDLTGAVAAEVQLELWSGHAGEGVHLLFNPMLYACCRIHPRMTSVSTAQRKI